MNKNNSNDKKFNLKNNDKIREFFASSKSATSGPLIDDNSKPCEVDEDGMEIFIIEDFNEPKEKVVEEDDNLDYEIIEGFNEFTNEEEEEVVVEEEFDEYEGSEHILSKLISNEGEDNLEYEEDYEGSDSTIAKLGQNMEFEDADFEEENKEDKLEYEFLEDFNEPAPEEEDTREYIYIDDDEEVPSA